METLTRLVHTFQGEGFTNQQSRRMAEKIVNPDWSWDDFMPISYLDLIEADSHDEAEEIIILQQLSHQIEKTEGLDATEAQIKAAKIIYNLPAWV